MQENEILDYYNENWNDYNLILEMLHKIIDQHEEEIKLLKKNENNEEFQNDSEKRIADLQGLLRECQDKLDEETHQIRD